MVAKTVIIADDTAYVRDRFAAALSDAGHRPILAGTVPELFACLRGAGARLDLLVIDLQLPGGKGTDLLKTIRDGGCQAPMLIFSGTIPTPGTSASWRPTGERLHQRIHDAGRTSCRRSPRTCFPDSFNRRASPRVALSVTVSLRVDNVIASAVSANVSKGGLQLRTMTPQPVGRRLRVRFRIPGGGREIDAEATVAWSDARSGMGVQFDRLDPQAQTELDEFVDRSFFSNRKA